MIDDKPLAMKEIQSVSLSVLKQISKLCEENGVRYSLGYGTLIGAIRHKGFIPWDDDIDILMPRPDYEKFLQLMANNPNRYIRALNYRNCKNYPHGITRVCDTRYIVVEEKFKDYGLGIFVDVYPVDGLGKSEQEALSRFDKSIPLEDIVMDIARKDIKVWVNAKPFKAQIKRCLRFASYFFHGEKYYLKQLEDYSMSQSYDHCDYVGVINWAWRRSCYRREWFDDLYKVPFEDSEFYIIKEYDQMLRIEYGDYMQLPPVENRIYQHCYSAYRK